MKYSITIEIGKDKYGYDTIKSECTIDAEQLHPVTLEHIVKAMVFDAEKKASLKFKNDTQTVETFPADESPSAPKEVLL